LNTGGLYGESTEEGNYKKLVEALVKLMGKRRANGKLTVDCANGVGAIALRKLIKYIPEDVLDFAIINDDVENHAKLNHQCGADFVKTNQSLPPGLHPQPFARYASLDGDADRVVYYYQGSDNAF